MSVCICRSGQTIIIIALFILLNPFLSLGQYTSSIKAHTFRIPDGLYTVSFEHAFNKHLSYEVALQGGDYIDVQLTQFEKYKVTGLGAIGSLRYYPFTKKRVAPYGFFGYFAFRYVKFTEEFHDTLFNYDYEVGGDIVNAGLGIGYKFVYRRVGLEAYVGWGAGKLKSDDNAYRQNIPAFHQSSIEEQEHFPQLDVAVCYMFARSL
jgi:hypothetical protein